MRDQMRQHGANTMPTLGRGIRSALLVAGCLSGSTLALAQDPGEQIFQQCGACHTIGGGKLVGPDLKGVNERRSADWLMKFIRSSQQMVTSGDKTAVALFAEFNKMPMPDQALSDEQIKSVLAHIKKAGGGGSTTTASTAPVKAATAEVRPEDIKLGQDLFTGKVRLAKGGPSCNACHNAGSNFFGGGVLAKDLTKVVSRMGQQGVSAILGNIPFPAMRAAYTGKNLVDKEIHALTGFLQQVDAKTPHESAPSSLGVLGAGILGILALGGVLSRLVGQNRKQRSVNQEIFDRQVKSE